MMLILACLALGVAACHDDVLAPKRNVPSVPAARAVSGPVAVARYTCVLSRMSAEVRCDTTTPAAPGVSPNVILPPSSPYAQFYPYDMVKDTVALTWTFAAAVKNLLAQPIGTLDGSTIVGTKVAITAGPTVTGGTGTVTVANADGRGTFTGPAQRYFSYPESTAPQAFTAEKLWRFNVPNTVTAISIGIVISTDFPAEQSVAAVPPDSVPVQMYADSNISPASSRYAAQFVRNVALVMFDSTATLADEQLAIAKVDGDVVGGIRVVDDDGFYYVRVAVDSANGIFPILETLHGLPHVALATPETIMDDGTDHLKAHDDPRVSHWELDPDNDHGDISDRSGP